MVFEIFTVCCEAIESNLLVYLVLKILIRIIMYKSVNFLVDFDRVSIVAEEWLPSKCNSQLIRKIVCSNILSCL